MSGEKRKLYIIFLLVITFSAIFWIYYNTPEKIVENTIRKVEVGDVDKLQLSDTDIEKIKYFVDYSNNQQLSTPDIDIKEKGKTENGVKVLASFVWIRYDKETGADLEIYDGKLLFNLIKTSCFKWEIQKVEIFRDIRKA